MSTAVCSVALTRQAELGVGPSRGPEQAWISYQLGRRCMPRSPPLGFAVLAPSARDNSVGILRALHAYTSRPVVLNTWRTLRAGRASGRHPVHVSCR